MYQALGIERAITAGSATRGPALGPERRQPVHTFYGGAHLFRASTPRKLGDLALGLLDRYAPTPNALRVAVGASYSDETAGEVHRRLVAKLTNDPIEDYRIDFEDGYGPRSDEEEDGHAQATGAAVAEAMSAGTLPRLIGIRVKAMSGRSAARSERTLQLFLRSTYDKAAGVPSGLIVTLPKIEGPREVEAFTRLLDSCERELGLDEGGIAIEVMIETPGALVGPDGRVVVPRIVEAGGGRVVSAHFGTYDYTAALSIIASHQTMTHPACDFARHLMQVSLASTGIWLGDGATNVLPVPIHRDAIAGSDEHNENAEAIHRAWRTHHEHVRRSLVHGFYQSWDLHPGQLVSRYAAVYGFFFENLGEAALRLRSFIEQAGKATLVGRVFDDAATGQGLINHFLRAHACGAVSGEDVAGMTGVSMDELRTRSFRDIVNARTRLQQDGDAAGGGDPGERH